MDCLTVSFFGHRHLDNAAAVERKLERCVASLLAESMFVEFLVGRNGDFDLLAASTVLRCRKRSGDDNSALVLVLPYETASLKINKKSFEAYYNEIEICTAAQKGHFKSAYQRRNRAMVDRSDLIVAWVEREGGANQALKYAERKGKRIINLCEMED